MKKSILFLMILLLALPLVLAEDIEDLAELVEENPEIQEYYDENAADIASILDIDTEGLSDEEIIEAQKQAIIDNLVVIQDGFTFDESTPDILIYLIDDERVNIELEGDTVIGISFVDGAIAEAQEGALADSSLTVTVTDEVFQDVNEEEFDVLESITEEDINFEGESFSTKLKVGVINTAATVLSWFS